ncbi:MAG: Tat pathway signal sequence [Eggerthellales bacterium]|nr:Tat pathway signal sequence [Eggerthellales bacterium]
MEERPKNGLEALLAALNGAGMDMGAFGGNSKEKTAEDEIADEVDAVFEESDVEEEAERKQRGRGHRNGGGAAVPKVSFIEDMAEWSKKRLIVAGVVAVIALLAAYWWFHPPINIHSLDTWFVVLVIMAFLWLLLRVRSRNYAKGTKKIEKSEGKAKALKTASFIPILVAVAFLVGTVMSLSLFPGNAAKYSSILTIQNEDFTKDIKEVNYSEVPIIDRSTAALLGNKEMGTIPEYVSQFEIDELYSQINYKGTPVRVSPLGYADLFKWLTNRSNGLPAYSLVDMTTQDAQIVSLPDGQGVKYSASEPLARNIDRYIQLKYPFYMFDEKSFEIDEDGHPWWICPVQDRLIGLFGGTTIARVILCDAVTGECQNLKVDEVPQWVDRVYPAELLIQQYNWYGSLNNGWFNSWLGQAGVVQTTPGNSGELGYNYIAKDDDVWVYTGVTSVVSDSSIIGFVLINQRTQETHFYSVAGATETSAMSSAEGQVQHLRYSATFPILINVADQPTYFMALKDGEGLVKKFAMVDIKSYQIVAIGDTVAQCQTEYLNLLVNNGIQLPENKEVVVGKKVAGTITKIAPVVLDGNTHYYVVLDGNKDLFEFPIAAIPEIFMYEEGDSISFTYIDGTAPYTVQSIG